MLVKLTHRCERPTPQTLVSGCFRVLKSRDAAGCLIAKSDYRQEEMAVKRADIEGSQNRSVLGTKRVVNVVKRVVASCPKDDGGRGREDAGRRQECEDLPPHNAVCGPTKKVKSTISPISR